MLQKDAKFYWSDQCQQAFDYLKNALITAPILVLPDFNRGFTVSTDASKVAIGYTLLQTDDNNREQVIAYGGRALRPAERSYTISELVSRD